MGVIQIRVWRPDPGSGRLRSSKYLGPKAAGRAGRANDTMMEALDIKVAVAPAWWQITHAIGVSA